MISQSAQVTVMQPARSPGDVHARQPAGLLPVQQYCRALQGAPRPRPGHRARTAHLVAAAPAPAAVLPTWLSPSAKKYRFMTSNKVMVRGLKD